MVKEWAPLAVTVCALLTVVLSLFGQDNYSRLASLKRAVEEQSIENQELRQKVETLRVRVSALREDPRELEKAARNELGLARPNEQVFIFDKRGSTRDRKS